MSDLNLRCPRCGGEMKNGMCVSCGYIEQNNSEVFITPEIPTYEPTDLTPEVSDIYANGADDMLDLNVDPLSTDITAGDMTSDSDVFDTDISTVDVSGAGVSDAGVSDQPAESAEPVSGEAVVQDASAPYVNTNVPYENSPMPGANASYGSAPMPGANAPYGSAPMPGANAPYGNANAPYGNPYVGPDGRFDPNLLPGYTQSTSNKSTGIIITFVVIILFVIIAGVVGLSISLKRYIKEAEEYRNDEWEFDDDDSLFDYDDRDYEPDSDYDFDTDDDYDFGYEGNTDFVDDIDWDDKSWKKENRIRTKDEIIKMGEYPELMNCIDKSVSYDLLYNNEEYKDKNNNVCIRIQYYQVYGTGHDEEINEALKDEAFYYLYDYEDYKDEYMDMFDEYGAGLSCNVLAYVTYNDDDTLSVVYDHRFRTAVEGVMELTCVNFDLTTGRRLDNTEILDYNDDFAKFLRQRMLDQMGNDCSASQFSDEYLLESLSDEYGLIFCYTPLGAECGINYQLPGQYGWITATLSEKEIDKYSLKL